MSRQNAYRIPENADVTKLIEDAKKVFYKDSNVIGVGIGQRRKGNETQLEEIALIVYVKSKMQKGKVKKDYLIPTDFQGMKTDVVAPFGPDAPKEALGFAESYQNSNDMSNIDLPRLHEQASVEAGGEIAWHGNVQDFGDVCVIEDDGTLIKDIGGSKVVDFVRAYKLFRTTHPDIYDFVTFFTDSDHGMPPQGGSSWYQPIFNDIQGIGLGSFNNRAAYGSNTLQGIMFLNQGHFPIWRYVMLQEQAHRWSAFARYKDTPAGPNKNDHMLGGWAHWALNFDEDKSPMSYDPYDWQETASGDFRRVTLSSEERSFCNLDLYLMGLLGPLEVGDFYLLSDLSLISGNLYSATKKRLTTQNVIMAEGSRAPSVSTSPKLIKTAFVVLTGDMQKVHDLADQVDFLRLRFQDDFYDATKNLARVDTTLGPVSGTTTTEFRTVSINIPSGTGRRSIEGTATFSSTVRRANVALNGFKLDFVSSDRRINIVEADTDIVSILGNTVRFRVQCNYADKNFDDGYTGYITALVIAEVG